ncbi:MAG TPA: S46 family peptidase, partial [Myxococcaceae bacterium]|nr:S46 family peptidase [Myxococcaceae bacterium]
GFGPDQPWLDRVRLGAIRLANGCSASLVSQKGLVMTNHHCVRDCIQDLSTPKDDYLAEGFFARSGQDERRCSKLEANQLLAITDVTEQITAATRGLEGPAFAQARKEAMARIEGACATGPTVRCDVVTLFHGGRYQLYRYRRYQDVRLVFAPEFPMAAFGGYPDNFNFPRYGFDVAFLRVYDTDAPASTPDALRWAKKPVAEGDLVFVAGNPGGTQRVQTVEQLAFQRDVALPWTLLRLAELRGVLLEFSRGNPELYRITRARIRTVENALKALRGRFEYLADPAAFERKRAEDAALRAKVQADPALRARFGAAWEGIAAALAAERRLHADLRMMEASDAFSSELFEMARLLVRAADELPKPSELRLREFSDARLPSLKQRILRQAPIPRDVEKVTLAFGLRRLRDDLGADNPFVQKTLGKEAPEDLARALVDGTRLDDLATREALWTGGKAAIEASTDPMIVLARRVDADARAVRKAFEEEVEAPLAKYGELLHQAHVAAYGTTGYPDATFTLRLSYGTVAGWSENGRPVPAMTRFEGLFARDTGKFPFAVAPTWLKARPTLDPRTPMDVATTNDIIGGNSGSPLLDRNGEVVGLIFDGNLPSLGGDYGYEAATNRAVALHGSAILEALDKVYGASRVAGEIRATPGPKAR